MVTIYVGKRTQDKATLLTGTTGNVAPNAFSTADFQALRGALDSYGHHFFACLAWLIAYERVQIRAIRPKHGRGIAHYKSGIFSDGRDKVKFKGSCNFTASGLLENLEELDVKTSWQVGNDAFAGYEQEYEQLFAGTADHAELIAFAHIEAAIIREYGGKELDELLNKTDLDRLRELNAAVQETGKPLNVYQLDMPDGVSNAYRSELEITIQKVNW